MKIAIMQPYFFPYIGYWQLINAVDKYVIYDDVNFIKGGWINRNRVLVGEDAKYINIQMEGASPNKLINEVSASLCNSSKLKTLKTLEHSYGKAPYFDIAFPIIKEALENNNQNLAEYLTDIIKRLCEYLGIDTEIILSSSIEKDNSLKGQDKIIEICNLLGAKEYYNAIGGQELYSMETFREKNIGLKFLKTKDIVYRQFGDEFIPNLSIIDVMMFNSAEDIQRMLSRFSLIE